MIKKIKKTGHSIHLHVPTNRQCIKNLLRGGNISNISTLSQFKKNKKTWKDETKQKKTNNFPLHHIIIDNNNTYHHYYCLHKAFNN